MKKYLMTGIAAVAMCAAFTSCSHDSDGFSTLQEAKDAEYAVAFEKAYGKISSTQDWGFGSSSRTRAHNANANEWAYADGDNWDVPQPLSPQQKDLVRRYFQQVKELNPVHPDYKNFFVQQVYKGGDNVDSDAETTEKFTNVDGSEIDFWGSDKMNYLVAGKIGTEEQWPGGPIIDKFDHINNFNYGDYDGENGEPNINVWDGVTYEDGYVLTGNYTEDKNHAKQHPDQIMLMVNSSTSSFGYTNSLQENRYYNDRYIIISGDDIMQWASDNNKPLNGANVSGMFFVGFDYDADLKHGMTETVKGNMYLGTVVDAGTEGSFVYPNNTNNTAIAGQQIIDGGRDYYYSDWIVRIVEAKKRTDDPDPVVESGRIFCEDLGSIGDFDFNDVVFDAFIYQSGKIHIDVLAAGGTLPMKVANHDIVAGMKNNVQKKMVNTGLDTAPVYSFDISAKSEGVPEYASLKDIPVVVTQKVNQYDQEIMLKAEIGAAPQKICLPVGTKWVDEYVDINAAYPNFENWVGQKEGITSPVQAVGERVEKFVDLILSNNAPYRTK